MEELRIPKVNSHVARLHRFLPFSSAHDQIYEEYQTGEDNLDLQTIAIEYAAAAIRSGAQCIILTGDAGHGKTHMCRRLIEQALLGHTSADSRELLLSSCDGETPISPANGNPGAKLRIHKDLSEMKPPGRAAAFLEENAGREGEALVVCANEGRLRAIINSDAAGETCGEISQLFRTSFRTGVTANPSGSLHIINLNYQSVAANSGGRGSLLRRVLTSWVGNGQRWSSRSCGACVHEPVCPIKRNRALLAEDPVLSPLRVHQLEELFEVIERLGHVVTIREMLMLVAYVITGGMTCEEVDRRARAAGAAIGWQHAWAFYNLLFRSPPGLASDHVDKGIPVLAAFRRLDPGDIALRTVDEKILNLGRVFEAGQLDLQFVVRTSLGEVCVDAALGLDDFSGNPQTKAEAAREAETAKLAVSALRRRAFFDDLNASDSVMKRLGFRHGDTFLKLISEELSAPEKVKIKSTVIAGLHAIQGLRIGSTETTLYLVDPAFGRASSDAAIIARQIPSTVLGLKPASTAWIGGADNWMFLPHSVDWIDRNVVFRVDERLNQVRDLSLDLLSFECVGRAASGYVSEEFYANEIRRVRTFLGQLAESGRGENAQIAIFMQGKLQNVSLDEDVIQVGGQ